MIDLKNFIARSNLWDSFLFISPKSLNLETPFAFAAAKNIINNSSIAELFSFEVSVANYFLLGWLSSGTSYIFNMIFGDNGVKHEHKYANPDTCHLDKQVDASTS